MSTLKEHTPEYAAWLASLKVGDVLRVDVHTPGLWTARKRIVHSLTAKRIRFLVGSQVEEAERYTGKVRGTYSVYILPWTEDDQAMTDHITLAKQVAALIGAARLGEFSTAKLNAIKAAFAL